MATPATPKRSGPRFGRYTAEAPPFLLNRTRTYSAALFLLVIGLNVGLMLRDTLLAPLGVPPMLAFALFIPYGFALAALIQWLNSAPREMARRIREGDTPCWQCGYSLAGHESPGTCPECGKGFERAETLERWQNKYLQYTNLRNPNGSNSIRYSKLTPRVWIFVAMILLIATVFVASMFAIPAWSKRSGLSLTLLYSGASVGYGIALVGCILWFTRRARPAGPTPAPAKPDEPHADA